MLRVRNEAGAKEFTYKVIVYSLPHLKNTSNEEAAVKILEAAPFTSDCDIDGIPQPAVCVIGLVIGYVFTGEILKLGDCSITD